MVASTLFFDKMPQNKLLYLTASGVGMLTIGLIIVSFKLYDFSVKNNELKDKITLEKSIHQNQISEILKRYDSVNRNYSDGVSLVKKSATVRKVAPSGQLNFRKGKNTTAKEVEKKLSACNINARGVRLISRDVVETCVSSKIDQVRIRFTLEENRDLESGNKEIAIQIINPKKRLLALKGKSETQLVKEVYYDRLNTDACVFIDLYQHQLIVGDYKINLVHNGEVIGSTNFRVN
ncbi:hypothetical protein FLJC2902T_03120 [Flavobacterium limnosediminis JC2902]|uniref:Uncharacterized protein n=2 Tax=Flavobacterium TaxID=237 RepID=V6STQ5_9FLAO|nr:hypothetical protein FLJC2902T_03120 [Flavobacterium limnosediminis JC2902]